MNKSISILLIFLTFSCNKRSTTKNEFLGLWQNEKKYSNLNLQIKENVFLYEYYTDRKPQKGYSDYPLKGTYTIAGNIITLNLNDERLSYGTKWKIIKDKNKKILLPLSQEEKWKHSKILCYPLYRTEIINKKTK